MSASEPTFFERMQERYRTRNLPWDHELPPPEIIALCNRLPPGRLLDLGCGAGRASIYLAARGWEVDAVDFVPEAIDIVRERAEASSLQESIHLHVASVTDLSFLAGAYDLAIDIGCFHALERADQQRYAAEVARLVRRGGIFMLFTRLSGRSAGSAARSKPPEIVEEIFVETFHTVEAVYGETVMADAQWASAWYELMRR
jgi:cyclopropane fatty-acyl-phospholipid synthase-like methyltransferase